MEMRLHLAGFRREVLAEIELAETQILALAESVPAEDYAWAPAEKTRTFAALMVHVAAGNLGLLDCAGSDDPEVVEFYAGIEGSATARAAAIVRRDLSLEKAMTEKAAIIDLLRRAFSAVKSSWTGASEEDLWATVHVFGQLETVRQLYLRMMAHSHEHLGQAIAYVRAMGYAVPWPDPVERLEEMTALVH